MFHANFPKPILPQLGTQFNHVIHRGGVLEEREFGVLTKLRFENSSQCVLSLSWVFVHGPRLQVSTLSFKTTPFWLAIIPSRSFYSDSTISYVFALCWPRFCFLIGAFFNSRRNPAYHGEFMGNKQSVGSVDESYANILVIKIYTLSFPKASSFSFFLFF